MNIMKTTLIVLVYGMFQVTAFAEPNRGINFVSEVHVAGDYQDVKIVGDRIYCANNYGVVVWTFDERSPETPPIEIGRFPTPGQAHSLFIDDTLCYVADGSSGMRIYNVANLEAVEELGACEEVRNAFGITVGDGIAYLTRENYMSGIYSIDVSDPSNPNVISFLEDFAGRQKLIIRDSILWMVVFDIGFYLTGFDVSDPASIRVVSQYRDSQAGGGFSFNNNIAYLKRDSLSVLDYSDLENIRLLATYDHVRLIGATYYNGYLYGDS